MHGTLDKTVHISHASELHARCPARFKREPYIIKGAGHENVVDVNPDMYFSQLRKFFASLHDDTPSCVSARSGRDGRALSPAGNSGGPVLDYERICPSCGETARKGSEADTSCVDIPDAPPSASTMARS